MSTRSTFLMSALLCAAGAAGFVLGHSVAGRSTPALGSAVLPWSTAAGGTGVARWYPFPLPVERIWDGTLGIAGSVWTPEGATWEPLEPAPSTTDRYYPTMVLLPDGQVLVHPESGSSEVPFVPAVPGGR